MNSYNYKEHIWTRDVARINNTLLQLKAKYSASCKKDEEVVEFVKDCIIDGSASDIIVLPSNVLAAHFAVMVCQKQRNYYFMKYIIYDAVLNLWDNVKPEFVLAFGAFNARERNRFIEDTKAEFTEWFIKTRKINRKEFYGIIHTAVDIPLIMKLNQETPNGIVTLFLTCSPI